MLEKGKGRKIGFVVVLLGLVFLFSCKEKASDEITEEFTEKINIRNIITNHSKLKEVGYTIYEEENYIFVSKTVGYGLSSGGCSLYIRIDKQYIEERDIPQNFTAVKNSYKNDIVDITGIKPSEISYTNRIRISNDAILVNFLEDTLLNNSNILSEELELMLEVVNS